MCWTGRWCALQDDEAISVIGRVGGRDPFLGCWLVLLWLVPRVAQDLLHPVTKNVEIVLTKSDLLVPIALVLERMCLVQAAEDLDVVANLEEGKEPHGGVEYANATDLRDDPRGQVSP